MFNACYGVQSARTSRWLAGATTPAFTATTIGAGAPLYFKPTELGRYMLYSRTKTFLDGGQPAVSYAADPGPSSNWVATMPKSGLFRFQIPGKGYLADTGSKATVTSTGTMFRLRLRSGCTAFPEISTNVSGNPFSGVSGIQEVRGFIDAHTHGMAFEFLGGQVHCGRPWSPYGVEQALKDCPDHEITGGKGAVMEAFLSNKPTHDPVGWPTFKDWPAPESLTHEGTYYKWMERSWRAGQRLLVNLLVENNKLCELYPLKRNSCNDMDSIRLQAKQMRNLENYVDAQHGGPGKGWYRIVTTPDQARRVINAGKLAVVMGIETSVPFDCTQKLGVPDLRCSKASIDRQLDEVRKLGVSQMELVNKFDNALSGVAGDEGSTGYLVNSANTLETGSPWRMQTCQPNDEEVHDKDQDNSVPVDSADIPAQDALFGAVAKVSGVNLPGIPLYPAKHHCNTLGLTELGDYTIRGLAKRNMLFDPDHMSVKARKASLDLIESLNYSGVMSSHSWSTPDAYPRIYAQKGFIAPYAGDSTGFVEKWRRHLELGQPGDLLGIRVRSRHQRPRSAGRPATQRGERPSGHLPVHHPGWGQGGSSGQWRAGLRHQQGRRRPLRPLHRLAAGPEDAGRERHPQGHVPRAGGLPADVGAGLRGQGQRVHDTELAAVSHDDPLPGQGRDDLLADPAGRRAAGPSTGQLVQLLLQRRHHEGGVLERRQGHPGDLGLRSYRGVGFVTPLRDSRAPAGTRSLPARRAGTRASNRPTDWE